MSQARNMGNRIGFDQSGALALQAFYPPIRAWFVANDSTTTALVVQLDGRRFSIPTGQGLQATPGDPNDVLSTFEVLSGGAWRFGGVC